MRLALALLTLLTACEFDRSPGYEPPPASDGPAFVSLDDEDGGTVFGCYRACPDEDGGLVVVYDEDGVYPDGCECP